MSEALAFLVPSIVAVTVYAVWWLSEDQKIRRALQRAPRVDICDAAAGQVVKIIGKVEPAGAQIQAPLSGRACVLYEVLVEEQPTGTGSGTWRTLIRETNAVDFLLDDATGRAIVHTRPIRVHAERDLAYDSGFLNDATPALEAFLEKHGRTSEGWVFNKRLRYSEGVLEAGQIVAALGEAGWERDPDPSCAGDGYRDVPKRLVLDAHDGAVIVSDEPTVTAVDAPRI